MALFLYGHGQWSNAKWWLTGGSAFGKRVITHAAMSTLPQLPIIDISPYLSDAPDSVARRKDVASALHSACTDFGFFYLNLSGFIDPSKPDGLAALAREFFHLPQEEKDLISLSNQDYARGVCAYTTPYLQSHSYQGYQKLKENVTNGKADNHEGIDFYRPVETPDKTKPLWGENQWPEKPAAFKAEFEDWVSKMKELGLIVMKACVAIHVCVVALLHSPAWLMGWV